MGHITYQRYRPKYVTLHIASVYIKFGNLPRNILEHISEVRVYISELTYCECIVKFGNLPLMHCGTHHISEVWAQFKSYGSISLNLHIAYNADVKFGNPPPRDLPLMHCGTSYISDLCRRTYISLARDVHAESRT